MELTNVPIQLDPPLYKTLLARESENPWHWPLHTPDKI